MSILLSILLAAAAPQVVTPQIITPQVAGPKVEPLTPAATGSGETSHGAPVNGVLTLFGNQRCPTDRNGNEIVVCVRRGASEQYRIPKDLRDFKVTPENAAWAAKLAPTMDAGAVGIGQCDAVGPSAGTGCLMQQTTRAKAEARDRIKDLNPDYAH